MAVKARKRVNLFGIDFDTVTRDYMVSRVDEAIAKEKHIWLTFINVSIVVQSNHDMEVYGILEVADYHLCDGMGLVYASRLLGKPLPEMVSGPLLLMRLLKHASDHGYRIYFLGSKQKIIERALLNVKRNYPGLQIVGYRNGYFNYAEEREVVALVRQSGAQILFVGMGFPRERIFIHKYRKDLKVPVIMDVGGALTVLAGIHRLAPRWMRMTGIEWVYRLSQEPRRLWKRYLVTNIIFGWLLLRELFRRQALSSIV